jgi:hypothetical protein
MHPTEDDFRLIPETLIYMQTRTINALLRGGFFTAEQIMMASTADLMNLKNFGVQSLAEVAAWRQALIEPDPVLYRETHQAVTAALNECGSCMADQEAVAAMRVVWSRIARGPFTATRIRQMLMPPEVQA